MARARFTDAQGNSYVRTSLTFYVPTDLLDFVRSHTGWSETKAVNWIINLYEYFAGMGITEKSVGVIPAGMYDDVSHAVTNEISLPDGSVFGIIPTDVLSPGAYSYIPGITAWERDGEVQDLQMGQIVVETKGER